MKVATKPSSQYLATFNKLKQGGLTEKEQTTLIAQASKDISKSSNPAALAKVYTEEVKGWVPKKLAGKSGTIEMAPWEFKNKANEKLINDFVGSLKGASPAARSAWSTLTARNPALKNIDLSSLKAATSENDVVYLSLKNTSGKALQDTDPLAVALKTAIAKQPGAAAFSVGIPTQF